VTAIRLPFGMNNVPLILNGLRSGDSLAEGALRTPDRSGKPDAPSCLLILMYNY
jgi:hypothetical protein